MHRIIAVLLLMLSHAVPVFAQTAGTYADRATLATQQAFISRISIAALVGAISVVTEDPATADHEVRVKLAAYVLREPEAVARRLSYVLASTVTVTVAGDGAVSTPLTDAQLQAVISSRWTTIANALVGGTL